MIHMAGKKKAKLMLDVDSLGLSNDGRGRWAL